jgi:hypothetical protein
MALYFTGRQHAGENLADVLRERRAELRPPVQMCFHGRLPTEGHENGGSHRL